MLSSCKYRKEALTKRRTGCAYFAHIAHVLFINQIVYTCLFSWDLRIVINLHVRGHYLNLPQYNNTTSVTECIGS